MPDLEALPVTYASSGRLGVACPLHADCTRMMYADVNLAMPETLGGVVSGVVDLDRLAQDIEKHSKWCPQYPPVTGECKACGRRERLTETGNVPSHVVRWRYVDGVEHRPYTGPLNALLSPCRGRWRRPKPGSIEGGKPS